MSNYILADGEYRLLSLIWGIYSEVKYMRNHSRKAAAAN